jgi:hypothetical protein
MKHSRPGLSMTIEDQIHEAAESLVAEYWRKHHGDQPVLLSDRFQVGVLYDFAVFCVKRLEREC